MNSTAIVVFSGIAAASGVLAMIEFIRSPQRRISNRIKRAHGNGASNRTTSTLFVDDVSGDSRWHWLWKPVDSLLLQSGIGLKRVQVVAAAAGLGIIAAIVGSRLVWWGWCCFLPGTGLAFVPLVLMRKRRMRAIERQLPQAFDIMRRAVSAGQSVPSAVQQVATQTRGVLAAEFKRAHDQQQLGLSFESALRELADRVPLLELRMLITALLFQRQSGGSPVEILENSAELVRKRQRMAARVRALTAEGRMQAIVLTALPLMTFLGLCLFRPDYIAPLLARPNILFWMLCMQIGGSLWVRRITRPEY